MIIFYHHLLHLLNYIINYIENESLKKKPIMPDNSTELQGLAENTMDSDEYS